MTHVRELAPGLDLLALQQRASARYPLLLESVASGTALGRWDMLLIADGARITLDRDGITRRSDCLPAEGASAGDDFLRTLDADWGALRRPRAPSPWPFQGGWALLLGYELGAQVEPVLRLPPAPGVLPVAVACRCPAAVLRDRTSGETVVLAEEGTEALLEQVLADIAAIPVATFPGPVSSAAFVSTEPMATSRPYVKPMAASIAAPHWPTLLDCREDPDGDYLAAVARALEYIRAGDVFQVNLSRAWEARFDAPVAPAALYERLRRANPAPFAGLFDLGDDGAVVSASPERLVSVRGDLVETRPIAGTRPRLPGDDDIERIREMVGHAKERAEHVMLVDLERNDLGRVSRAGSVEVDELMVVESYAHVHHIVSNVRGRLRADATPGEVLRAVFPGGTITGAPKVRCMEIIAGLEGVGRGAYTGAMGWLDRSGDMDLNILIRSAEVGGDVLRFRTGAGIVADSDPAHELDETRAKARGMLQAIGA
ncbi:MULTISPECIES: chorismate-binding protein [unclassified Luteimonas]